jgi:hypothetical protein|tara:strand:+ start:308 stop:562 length:255 start_codon:yes stop_codon:yes gene_type:complete
MVEPKAYEAVSERVIGEASKLYSETDCSYFGLVLIPRNEVWWIPFSEIKGKHSVCTNIERDGLAEYRGATDGLKKVPAEVVATI